MANQPDVEMKEEPIEICGSPAASASGLTLEEVTRFLRENNYYEAAAALNREQHSNVLGSALREDAAVKQEPSADTGRQSLLELYSKLVQFIETVRSELRPELAEILYPMFVASYLALVGEGNLNTACELFHSYSSLVTPHHESEMVYLKLMKRREHMAVHPIVNSIWSHRGYVVRLSEAAYDELKQFLTSQAVDLLKVVYKFMYIDVVTEGGKPERGLPPSLVGHYHTKNNIEKVAYAVSEVDYTGHVAAPEEPDSQAPAEGGEERRRKKLKKDTAAAARRFGKKAEAPTGENVPLPDLQDHEKVERGEAQRETLAAVNAEAPPSCCIFSLTNCRDEVICASFSDDGSVLAAGFHDSTVKVWSLNDRALPALLSAPQLQRLEYEALDAFQQALDPSATKHVAFCGHTGPVYQVTLSFEKHKLLSCSEDSTIRLWSLLTRSCLVVYRGHMQAVWCTVFSNSAFYFASGGMDCSVRMWSTEQPTALRICTGHMLDVSAVHFHPNSHYIVSGSWDRTVRCWDVSDGRAVRRWYGNRGSIQVVQFSPSGLMVAAGDDSGGVLVWNFSTSALIARLEGHTTLISALAWDREEGTVVTADLAGTVRCWQLTGKEVNAPILSYKCYVSRSRPILTLHFTRGNVLFASGPFHAR